MTRKPVGYYTPDQIAVDAKLYVTRNAFKRGSHGGAYKAAVRLGLLDTVCQHMVRSGDRKHRYVYEIVCHTRKIAYVGLIYNPSKRLSQHNRSSRHITIPFATNDLPFRLLTGLLSVDDAASVEQLAISHYRDVMGYRVLNTAKAGGLGGANEGKWSLKTIRNEAKKYQTRDSFCRGSKGAYAAACGLGILDDICSHMIWAKRPAGWWTPDRLRKEALKYPTRLSFLKGNVSAYRRAKLLNDDSIFAHMTRRFTRCKP